ncbi:MAG: type VI secretion system tip protein VgrG [Burkholderiales bacterium]|nr:type VI secretion system tip protein VgrG [Burkholderiales bacterium]
MPMSPQENAEGPVSVTVTHDGVPLADSATLVSVTVRRALNKVPVATLVFLDGDMPEGNFPLSDCAALKPGAEVTIKAGYADEEAPIFSGIVVKQGLTISGANDARLVIECRDKAIRMTVGRRNARYEDQTDGEILSRLASSHGLGADVSGATLQHSQLVQHYCTDWDFLLARAEANGCIVVATDGTVAVAEPRTSGEAALKVAYGESLIEFEAELDARHQFFEVQAQAWDAATQTLLEGTAAAPAALNHQGNLDSAALASVLGIGTVTLQTGAALPKAALDRWASAQQLKSGLSRLRGRMRFQGSSSARLGELVELAGVGERFAGSVLATGLTHRIADGAWTTEVEFGTPIEWFTERPDIVAPSAAGWVPGIEGLHVGTVLKLDADPAGQNRVQVALPAAGVDSVWARLMQFHASNAFGALFVPEVGDEVLLGFLANDPACPVVLGSLYSGSRPPPQALTAGNHLKSIVTRCKARLEFNDEDKVITVSTPGANTVVLSDKDRSVVLTDQNGNKVRLEPGGISMESPKDIRIDAKGAITVCAVGALTLSAKGDVKLEGLNVACEAQVGLTAKGSATAELSAAGQTTVKGAMVMIN